VAASGETNGKGWPLIIVHKASEARFILIPEGRFVRGTSDAKHPFEDEKPAHLVYLDPFYIQETEVTFCKMEWFFETHRHVDRPEEYLEALRHLKVRCASTAEALEHPAVCITRELAGQFAESIGGRLPTEAEYEYAARSGGKKYTYVWGNDLKTFWDASPEHKANLLSDGTKPVGRCRDDRTEQGIFDLAGNVREWCLDIWAPYSAVEVANPKGPPASGSASDEYAIRGGSFLTPPHVAAHTTDRSKPEVQRWIDDDLGFRVALPIGPGQLPRLARAGD
jgi:eukaryotic-like serine/threonine-protein kinase